TSCHADSSPSDLGDPTSRQPAPTSLGVQSDATPGPGVVDRDRRRGLGGEHFERRHAGRGCTSFAQRRFVSIASAREGIHAMSNVGDWNEAASELNAIVASFDEGEVSVDELFAKLERATSIIEVLEERLTATKARVDELAPRK